MKRLLFGSLVVAALLTAGAVAQDKTTIKLSTPFDATAAEAFQTVIDDFQKANPQYEVKMTNVAGSGAAVYPDTLRTAMAAGDPPDVFFLWGGSISKPFIKAGQVAALDNVFAKYKWKDRFPAWTVARLQLDGKQYGVPYHGQGMGFFYRKDLFDKAGISSLPTSYADLAADCAKLKTTNVYCASTGGKFGWHVMRLVDYFLETSCGPDVHDQINALKASWDQPCVVAGYQKLKDWIDKGYLVPDFLNVAPDDARIPVYQGQAAMILEGPWFEPALQQADQDAATYGFFLPPTDHEPLRYSAFPEQWMISAGSKHQDAAAAFIDYISSLDVQKAHLDAFQASATVGLKPDCAKTPLTCQIVDIVQSDRPAYPPTDQAFEKELMDSFFEVQDGIVAGKLSPAEGAKLMEQRAGAWKAKQS